jgi:hypothetical protein
MRPIFLILILFSTGLQAQINEWNVKNLFNDKIEVKYRISEKIDENGACEILIEDNATTTDSLSLQKCISFMNDISKHKQFSGDKISEMVKTISDSTWVVYYYTDNPWPINNSDCVALMKYSRSSDKKTACFSFTAAPTEYESRNVNRMTNYNITYLFEDLGNGKVKILMSGRTSPPVKVPLWLIKSAFPKAPVDGLRKMVKLIKEMPPIN